MYGFQCKPSVVIHAIGQKCLIKNSFKIGLRIMGETKTKYISYDA